MKGSGGLSIFLLVSPILILLITRLGIEFSITILPPSLSWIPAFLIYYLAIFVTLLIVVRIYSVPLKSMLPLALTPVPNFRLMFWGVIFPALLPLAAFILHIQEVPTPFIFYILVFALINPLFEESFWRGCLYLIPGNNTFRTFYSAGLFSFSHYFFWDYWFKSPWVTVPAVISTFVMGILWMWFMQKQKNLLYPILSHAAVDIFNLSVAVYAGVITLH